MRHKILIYGGLGNLASERIIPSLDSLSSKFSIEYTTVDLKDVGLGKYYKYGTEPLQDYNIAIIATPNNTHASIAVRALDSGLNILCEKPLAHTTESAKQILRAAQSRRRLTSMLGDHYVYKPSIRHVICNWQSYHKEIGSIISIEAKVFEKELQKGREWLLNSEVSGGGVAMDTGFHIVSIMGKLFGYENLAVVEAKMKRSPQALGNAETYASIMLSASEALVHIEVGKWMGKIEKQIVFKGSNATLRVSIESGEVMLDDKIKKFVTKDDCYPVLLGEFLSAIEEQRAPWTTLEEGCKALRIITKAYEMAGWTRKI